MNKHLIVPLLIGLSLSLAASLHGQETPRQINWTNFTPSNAAEKLVVADGRACLKIENAGNNVLSVNLGNLDSPGIATRFYAIEGEVKYERVSGDGFLEMWNVFPSGRAFSRTLAQSGPLRKISGTSPRRRFVLPFDSLGVTSAPTRLEINLVLPGSGTVWLGPCQLAQYPKATTLEDVLSGPENPGEWWSMRAAGKIGGYGGGACGALGALFGCLAPWLVPRGRGRGFMLGSLIGMSVLGFVLLIAGGVAVIYGQPHHVYYPLLLGGVILSTVFGGNAWSIHRHYLAVELRQIEARDACAH